MNKAKINFHLIDSKQSWSHYDQQRSNFQRIFADYLLSEPGLEGRVLDIGCGHSVNPTLELIKDRLKHLDGVDPFPAVEPPPHLRNRWTCSLEDLPVPDNSYDLVYSYNVVEHVANVDHFLKKAIALLKPGQAYWSVSPNYHHPFTSIVRLFQILKLKRFYVREINNKANTYPAFYTCSNYKKIITSIDRLKLPVSKVDFYYLPNVNWDTYFPANLRWIPHLMDETFILRKPLMSFIFFFRMEKNA